MQSWLSRLQRRHWIGLAVIALLLVAAAVVVFVRAGGWEWARTLKVSDVTARIQALGPWVFFSALAVLPAFGFPVSPFHLVSGKTFGLPLALSATLLAIAANSALSYGLARSVLHPVIERVVRAMGREVPRVPPAHHWMVALLLRVTPGPPFFVQSYLLALGGVPFGIYMVVSVSVSFVLSAAVIIFGESLLSGSAMKAVYGALVVVAVVIIIRLLRRRLQVRAAAVLPANPSRDE